MRMSLMPVCMRMCIQLQCIYVYFWLYPNAEHLKDTCSEYQKKPSPGHPCVPQAKQLAPVAKRHILEEARVVGFDFGVQSR